MPGRERRRPVPLQSVHASFLDPLRGPFGCCRVDRARRRLRLRQHGIHVHSGSHNRAEGSHGRWCLDHRSADSTGQRQRRHRRSHRQCRRSRRDTDQQCRRLRRSTHQDRPRRRGCGRHRRRPGNRNAARCQRRRDRRPGVVDQCPRQPRRDRRRRRRRMLTHRFGRPCSTTSPTRACSSERSHPIRCRPERSRTRSTAPVQLQATVVYIDDDYGQLFHESVEDSTARGRHRGDRVSFRSRPTTCRSRPPPAVLPRRGARRGGDRRRDLRASHAGHHRRTSSRPSRPRYVVNDAMRRPSTSAEPMGDRLGQADHRLVAARLQHQHPVPRGPRRDPRQPESRTRPTPSTVSTSSPSPHWPAGRHSRRRSPHRSRPSVPAVRRA